MKVIKTLEVSKDGEWMVASMPSVDRDKDRVFPRGIDLTNFRRNPIMFFGHNYKDPWAVVGTAAEIQVSGDSFKVKPKLREPANESDPMHIIRALWEANILRAASIGFIPKKGKPNSFGGTDYEEVELLEISIVPLPANQDALRLAVKGLEAAGGVQLPPHQQDVGAIQAKGPHSGELPLRNETDADLADALEILIRTLKEVYAHE